MTKKPKSQKTDETKKQAESYIKYSGLAFEMLTTIGAGALLGWWLDSKRGPNAIVFTAAGSILGIAIALYRVYKMVSS